jgi:myo-inositol-1(or 4)-monophosphatase
MSADLELLVQAACEAGEIALRTREKGLRIWSKTEGSPVTDADLKCNDHLMARLRGARPGYGWLSEETADDPERLGQRRIFVVDPIDGTAAFMKSRPWWSVAVAVVEDGRPTAAVVHAPAIDETFEAARGAGARLNGQPIRASDATRLDDASLLADARLLERPIWSQPWPAVRVTKRDSIAYRMSLVASGAFDAALAVSPKWDWDVCAGALIAEEAGAKVTDHQGRPYLFNRPVPRQASLLCAAPGLHTLILGLCAPIPILE